MVLCPRRNTPFTTCWGACHVKHAMGGVIAIMLTFELIETLQYIFNPNLRISGFSEFLFEVIESLILFSVVYGWYKEEPVFFLAFIFETLLSTIVCCLMTLLFFFCFILPDSPIGRKFSPDIAEDMRRYFFLFTAVVTFISAFVVGWFLSVSLGTYQYFIHKKELEEQRRRRPLPSLEEPSTPSSTPKSLALVIPTAVNSSAIEDTASGNFANPNYSDDEEELFRGDRGGVPV